MMTGVFFDARFINPTNPDGVSRFSLGLLQELKRQIPLKIIVSSSLQEQLIGEGEFVRLPPVTSGLEVFTALKLNRMGAKVVFSPMQTTSSLGRKFKLILTLHDLIYYRHRTPPKSFNPALRAIWYLYHLSYWPQRLVLNAADAVVTVSETSKQQIVDARLTKRPIEVIYNAAAAVTPNIRDRSQSKTVAYMGSFIGYKNVETLVRAAGLCGLRLALLSRIPPARKLELQGLADQVGADVEFVNGVSDQEYLDWLGKSRALVSASLDEGFGIPVVEAMSSGTPVVLSDLPIFREVAGEAGHFFPAMDAQALSDQLLALGDRTAWTKSAQAAIAQAQKFSWESSAKKLAALIRRLAS